MTSVEELSELPDGVRSRLLSALSERDRLERVLLMLPAAMSGSAPQRAAEVLAEASCELTGARLALVILPDLLGAPLVAGADTAWLDRSVDPAEVPALMPAFDGHLVHVADTSRLDAAAAETWPQTLDGRALRCLLAIPVAGEDGRVAGVVLLAHHRANAFSDRQVSLAKALVTHLGHAFALGSTMVEQTRIATALQESLLPPLLPAVPGVEVAARYRPSGSGNLVGGDFYDVFVDSVGGWYVLLGDASGIGPEAAGLAGIARYTARALADPAPPPAEVLERMNQALLRAAADGRFCTAALARFRRSPDGAVLVTVGSSGHPPALVRRAGGRVEPAVEATGTALGVVDGAPIGQAELRLGPGDALVFYTDGIIEARAEDRVQFGEDRLVDVLAATKGRSAEGTARRIERAVLDYRTPEEGDDMAIVVVRVLPGRDGPAPGPRPPLGDAR